MTNDIDVCFPQLAERVAWMRCATRLPIEGAKYYLLIGCQNNVISFYSKGVAWNGDVEIRVARLVKALDATLYYRRRGLPCLILEDMDDFDTWYSDWGCHALIVKNVWDSFNSD